MLHRHPVLRPAPFCAAIHVQPFPSFFPSPDGAAPHGRPAAGPRPRAVGRTLAGPGRAPCAGHLPRVLRAAGAAQRRHGAGGHPQERRLAGAGLPQARLHDEAAAQQRQADALRRVPGQRPGAQDGALLHAPRRPAGDPRAVGAKEPVDACAQAQDGQGRVGRDRCGPALQRPAGPRVARVRPGLGRRQGPDHDAAGGHRRAEGRRRPAGGQREGDPRQRGRKRLAVHQPGHAGAPRAAAQRRHRDPRRPHARHQPAHAGVRQPRRGRCAAHRVRRQGAAAQRALRQLRAQPGPAAGQPAGHDEGRHRARDRAGLLRPREDRRG
ncbi:hypothetical protein D3C72_1295550 [compost metagenome]